MSDSTWNGEGLPPVGARVGYAYVRSRTDCNGECVILGYDGDQVWFKPMCAKHVTMNARSVAFRPACYHEHKEGGAEWNVGDLVEGDNGSGKHPYEILALSGKTAWLRRVEAPGSRGVLYPIENMKAFRTPEQRSVEAMRKATSGKDDDENFYDAIYTAIREGRIPGVKLEGKA